MQYGEAFKLALQSLWANKLRSIGGTVGTNGSTGGRNLRII
jgi:hypothetical protein